MAVVPEPIHQEARVPRRTRLCIVAGVVAVGVAVIAFVVLTPPRLSRERMEAVRVGMSRAEVVALVGEPGDYAGEYTRPDLENARFYWAYEGWLCTDGHLVVRFDANGVAGNVEILDVVQLPRLTLLQRIRTWLAG